MEYAATSFQTGNQEEKQCRAVPTRALPRIRRLVSSYLQATAQWFSVSHRRCRLYALCVWFLEIVYWMAMGDISGMQLIRFNFMKGHRSPNIFIRDAIPLQKMPTLWKESKSSTYIQAYLGAIGDPEISASLGKRV
jgi:hypothetical protein